MLPINPSSIFFPCKPSLLPLPQLSPSTVRCRAAGDLPLGPTFPRWLHFPAVADVSVGGRISQDSDGDGVGAGAGIGPAGDGSARRSGGNSGVKVNAREKRWSRNRESYLADDEDALPLPMTYPDTSPVSPEEIDRRLRCDPIVEVVFLRNQPLNRYDFWQARHAGRKHQIQRPIFENVLNKWI